MNDPKIIIALDYPEATPALALVDKLQPSLCRLKVGKELFTAAGPGLIEQLQQRGFLRGTHHAIQPAVARQFR